MCHQYLPLSLSNISISYDARSQQIINNFDNTSNITTPVNTNNNKTEHQCFIGSAQCKKTSCKNSLIIQIGMNQIHLFNTKHFTSHQQRAIIETKLLKMGEGTEKENSPITTMMKDECIHLKKNVFVAYQCISLR
jgi:hypothetical protein